jgi:hypothetical protein
MAVKKPLRRKRTRGPNFAGMINFAGMKKAIRSNRWTGTSGTAVAVAFVALVAILAFAYSASTPGEPRSARPAERPVAPRPAAPVNAAAKESPATPVTRTEASDLEADGVITGPMPTVVTLTGCLARSDNEFRLKDTTGLNAPKSRSWKSGFLTKRSASISIVPASGELPLSKHVGERVTVSGTLIDREMKVRTLRRVSSSCDEPTPGRITA